MTNRAPNEGSVLLRVRSGMRRLCWIALCSAVVTGCRGESRGPAPLRLGAFPNLTHAQALVGVREDVFARAVAPAPLEVKQFNAGPAAMEALASGSLEMSYVGVGPAINAYLKGGRAVRIVAAAAGGGAVLVTRSASAPEALRGQRLAAPQRGNTQDIALRHWLRGHGLTPGRDLEVIALPNAEIQGMFERGQIEGAWVPEPWGARLIAAGGKILVDERDLWPERRFQTTVLVTTARVLERRRDDVKRILRAHVELTRRWQADPQAFFRGVQDAFRAYAGQGLNPNVAADAFSRVEPMVRPLEANIRAVARQARELGYLQDDDVSGIVDVRLLDEVLREMGNPSALR